MSVRDTVFIDVKTTGAKESAGMFGNLAGPLAIGAAIAAFKILKDATEKWVNAASDAEEINSKFATTFDQISVSAEKAATSLSKGYGIAESTAKDLLSATGDMLSGFGATDTQALALSEKLQRLAIDLASFTNYAGGAEGASAALTKGILGEREGMKSLGIAINETDVKQRLLEKGMSELEGTALKMARAEITLELAYEQSANALGDYERTQDSYANATRRAEEATKYLQEELGQRLLPLAGKIKDFWATVVTELADSVKLQNDLREGMKARKEGVDTTSAQEEAFATSAIKKVQSDINLLKMQGQQMDRDALESRLEQLNLLKQSWEGNKSIGAVERDSIDADREKLAGQLKYLDSLDLQVSAQEEVYNWLLLAEEYAIAIEQNNVKITDEYVAQEKAKQAIVDLEKEHQDLIAGTSKTAIESAYGLESSAERRAELAKVTGEEFDKQAFLADGLRKIMVGLVAEGWGFAEAGDIVNEEYQETDSTLTALEKTFGHYFDKKIEGDQLMVQSEEDMYETMNEQMTEYQQEKWMTEQTAQREALQKEYDEREIAENKALRMEAKLFDEAMDERAERHEEALKEQFKAFQNYASAVTKVSGAITSAITTINQNAANDREAIYDSELADIIANLEASKDWTEKTEQEKAAAIFDASYALNSQRSAALRKEAEDAKALSLFEIAINTASAIIASLPNIPLSIAAGIAGIIQFGVVAATPVPAFADGGSFKTDGPQLFMAGDNEGGEETVNIAPTSSAGSGGGGDIFELYIADKLTWSSVTRGTANGNIKIKKRSIIS